jgi:hypothetical protein
MPVRGAVVGRWRKQAVQCLANALLEYEAQQVCLELRIDPEQARAAIRRSCYPFGERTHYPYKVWLEECRRVPVFLRTRRPAIQYLQWRYSAEGMGCMPRDKSDPKGKDYIERLGQLRLNLVFLKS